MSLSRRLWAANRDWADRILAHGFVRGLGDGSLPADRFRGYVAQDAYFLEAFAQGDFPLLMPWMVIVTLSVLMFNLIADIVYGLLDPRIRYD